MPRKRTTAPADGQAPLFPVVAVPALPEEIIEGEIVTEPAPSGAGDLVGGWIDRCRVRPPQRIIARVGKCCRELLAENIPAEVIARGLEEWRQRGADPAALPSFVNQAANAVPSRRSGGYMGGTEHLRQSMELIRGLAGQ